ncbi:MAG: hypothetical protein AVDCRST_MAG76-382 [uncultured Acidimicrobiales bacterium]|uniref:Uncharacterized protein n=1 Tax=uncultured Acidimicrobiales bacterium TaxID=310071 RepID=A0A6J4H7E5_9ACTN|nr:MAG: hypothetical protein AVDCRST_MAG76-382 [uncultured Acidimicrobiales bacterium]
MADQAILRLPSEVVEQRLRPTRKERLRVVDGYSVKLDCRDLRVFLREADWRTLVADVERNRQAPRS